MKLGGNLEQENLSRTRSTPPLHSKLWSPRLATFIGALLLMAPPSLGLGLDRLVTRSLVFEENLGQTDPRVRFLTRPSAGTVLHILPDQAVLVGRSGSVVLRLVGANPEAAARGAEPLAARSHHFRGCQPDQWVTDVPLYRSVRVASVYPGIDWVLYEAGSPDEGSVEYDFVVAPGADPSQIRLEIETQGSPALDAAGNLDLGLPGGGATQRRPTVLQSGGRIAEADYRLCSNPSSVEVTFDLPRFDPNDVLVVDPVLELSTYLGGSDLDEAQGIATDASGAIYVTGTTRSSDFPVAAPYQGAGAGGDDAFISKLDATGNLVFSTYLGGSSDELAIDVAVDPAGFIYFGGDSRSDDYPLASPFKATLEGNIDPVMTKLTPAGDALVYSTYLGAQSVGAVGVGADAAGNGYLGFYEGPFSSSGMVARLDPAGAVNAFAPISPSASLWKFTGVTADPLGFAYVVWHEQTWLPGVAFFSQLDLSGGGGGFTYQSPWFGYYVEDVEVDPAGRAWAVGSFEDPDGPPLPPPSIVFVWEPNDSIWYFGGSGYDFATSLALDDRGTIWITGTTTSQDFPLVGALRETRYNDPETFLARLDLATHRVEFSTYFGGTDDDVVHDMAPLPQGGVGLVGSTASTDFPLASPLQTSLSGPRDGFVSRFGGSCQDNDYLVGPGAGPTNPDRVRVYSRFGTPSFVDFHPYGSGNWGVNVASGGLDPDPCGEILTGPGPGDVFGPNVKGHRRDGSSLAKINFYAYSTLRFGVNVAAGDVERDGFDEILSGAGPGAIFGPHLRGWQYDGNMLASIGNLSFFAYSTLKYGVNVARAELDLDGADDIITGPGPGVVFAPMLRGWQYDGGPVAAHSRISFWAFPVLQYGANVAGGDVDVDGYDEMGAAPGPGPDPSFPARYRGFDYDDASVAALPGFDVVALPSNYGGRLGLGDILLDGPAELIAGAGPDPAADSSVLTYRYSGAALTLEPVTFVPFGTSTYGVKVSVAGLGH